MGGTGMVRWRPAWRVTWWRVLAGSAVVWWLLAASWALASPLFSVPDEAAHIMRAASVHTGELLGVQREVTYAGPPPVTAVLHEIVVPAPFAELGGQHICFAPFVGTADCAAPLAPAPGRAVTSTTAGAYQPLFYAVVGTPIGSTTPVRALYLGRLLHVTWGAALLAGATALAWQRGGSSAVGAVVVSVTPIAAYLLGSINPNGIEIAAALLLWLAVPALLTDPRRRHAVLVAVATTSLAWARPLSPLIVVGIAAACACAVADRTTASQVWRSVPARVAVLWSVLATAGAAAWVGRTGALQTFIGYPDPTLTPGVIARQSRDLSADRILDLVGVLGWLDTPIPDPLQLLWLLAALMIVGSALRVADHRQRAVLGALVLAIPLVPFLADLSQGAELGLIWQSRYTLPIAVGTTALAGWIRAGHPVVTPPRLRAVRVGALWLVVGAVHGYAHMLSMSRYSTGFGSSLCATWYSRGGPHHSPTWCYWERSSARSWAWVRCCCSPDRRPQTPPPRPRLQGPGSGPPRDPGRPPPRPVPGRRRRMGWHRWQREPRLY